MHKLKESISKRMSEYRYLHTLSVARECERLAEIFGIDGKLLITSAYLHDITKEMTVDEQTELCRSMGERLDEYAILSPKTLHSYSAPALIKRDYPEFADPEVLSTVRCHTTGKENMTLPEKLLYLADYIEPTRKFEECKKLREFFYSDLSDPHKRLDSTIFLSLKYTLYDLLAKGEFIHPETVKAYNSLCKIGVL